MLQAMLLAAIVAAPLGSAALFLPARRHAHDTGVWPAVRRFVLAIVGTVVVAAAAAGLLRLLKASEHNLVTGVAALVFASLVRLARGQVRPPVPLAGSCHVGRAELPPLRNAGPTSPERCSDRRCSTCFPDYSCWPARSSCAASAPAFAAPWIGFVPVPQDYRGWRRRAAPGGGYYSCNFFICSPPRSSSTRASVLRCSPARPRSCARRKTSETGRPGARHGLSPGHPVPLALYLAVRQRHPQHYQSQRFPVRVAQSHDVLVVPACDLVPVRDRHVHRIPHHALAPPNLPARP